ncbi:MAG TPA: DUF134 domain-containing protein [Syntrophorhabdaceae bacterium]|jgi:predicted DNA-binding protein (UPF0251 family)
MKAYHEQAALKMKISRATFGSILREGRRKKAKALIEGKVLTIETANQSEVTK